MLAEKTTYIGWDAQQALEGGKGEHSDLSIAVNSRVLQVQNNYSPEEALCDNPT